MGWDDINFDIIVPRMITLGPAEVSFADYLNVFSKALDEKLSVIMSYPKEGTPNLPNIEFEQGEIRDDVFWGKYRDLLSEYWSIYTDNIWYKEEALDNRDDPSSFIVDDQDIIDLIGQDAFDAFSQVNTLPAYKIFTSDVLNGIYLMYEFLIYKKSVIVPLTSVSDQRANTPSTFGTGQSVYSFFGRGEGSSESEAIQDYNDDLDQSISSNGNTTFCFSFIIQSVVNPLGTEYRVVGGGQNNTEIYYFSKDLEGNPIEMEFHSISVQIYWNYIFRGPVNRTTLGVYDDNYPLVEDGQPPKNTFIDPNVSVFQENTGVRHTYSYLEPVNSTNITIPSFQVDYNKTGSIAFFTPSQFITNLNNPALEFYIPKDQ
jgi:hypothetical protein